MRYFSTDDAPTSAAYPQAVILEPGDKLVGLSGLVAFKPGEKQIIDGDAAAQAEQIFKYADAILEYCGSSKDRLFRVTILLANKEDFASVNAVYLNWLEGCDKPVRATFAVGFPIENALVEIVIDTVVK
ncbi:MAG: RidA family protein [Patescibacteria group bacterium]|jgi:2-iminobutanoate/2-iminopropanoate deaminase